MATKVKPIPDGYASVTPYLVVDGGVKALDFYKAAFGATEIMRMEQPNGRLGHAEFRIGNSIIMMADEHPQMGYRGPKALGGTPVSILLYVEDVDTVAAKVVKEGAKVLRPVENQFYGDRSGTFEDPFGHVWTVASHVEDIAPEEMKRRVDALHADHV
jgi:PhnB protein